MRANILPYIISVIFVSVLETSLGFASSVYKFDFGTEASAVFSGFTRITRDTLYSRQAGYGWARPVRGKSREHFDRKYYDYLCCDLVLAKSATFNLDVPKGWYIINLWIGDLHDLRDYLRFGVAIEGKEIVKARNVSFEKYCDLYFKNIDYIYKRQDSVWEKFINPLFVPKAFYAEVNDGQLNITFSNCRLNAMTVYPLKSSDEAVQEVQAINKRRRRWFESKWSEKKNHVQLPPKLAADGKEKGYLVFLHHWMHKVYPHTTPKSTDIAKKLKVSCAKGEFEPVCFCVYAWQKLEDVKITVSDLTASHGKKLDKSNVEVRVEKYRLTFTRKRRPPRCYRVSASDIPEFEAIDVSKEVTTRFWLDIYVPPEASAGIYKGTVEIKPANAPSSELRLELEVLPFELLRDRETHNYAFQYITPGQYLFFPGHNSYWQYLEKDFLFMKKFGITLPTLGYDRESKPTITWDRSKKIIKNIDLSGLAKTMEVYRKVGGFPSDKVIYCFYHLLTGRPYGLSVKRSDSGRPSSEQEPTYWRAYKEIVKAVWAKQAERDWPEFIFLCTGEMSNGGPDYILFGKRILVLLRGEMPAIKLAAMVNSFDELKALAPYAQTIGVQRAFCTVPMLSYFRENNMEEAFWLYQAYTRFTYGFYHYKSAARGTFKEDFQHTWTDPYNSFDGPHAEVEAGVGYAFGSPNGPVPTKKCYDLREGIDDARYLYTLKAYISKAKQSGVAKALEQAESCQKLLQEIMQQVPLNLAGYDQGRQDPWDCETYDKLRAQIAAQIEKLAAIVQ